MHNPSTKLTDVKELQGLLKNKPEKQWNKLGEKMALKLFKDMSQNVPAYKDFLKKNNFKASSSKKIFN